MIEKSKLKQFLCGLAGHSKRSAQYGGPEEGYSWHDYCGDCGKTINIYIKPNHPEDAKQWVLKKI